MTSGNRSDEPIAYEDDDALERLAGIADLFLIHDRPIHVRCDDSVTRVVAGRELADPAVARLCPAAGRAAVDCRAADPGRGRAAQGDVRPGPRPAGVPQPSPGRPGSFRGVSGLRARYRPLRAALRHPARSASCTTCIPIMPRRVTPGSAAEGTGVELVAVQHHHAHMASCMAEHGLTEPVIGVTFDGTGFGTDGAVWGGEFLVGDYREFHRAAHLRYVGLPGGEQAIREPWRMAAAHLLDAGAT